MGQVQPGNPQGEVGEVVEVREGVLDRRVGKGGDERQVEGRGGHLSDSVNRDTREAENLPA